MNLTDDQAAAVRYCVADVVRRRRLSGEPIPQWLRDLASAMSSRGPEPVATRQDSNESIGSAQAARLLGCTRRHISRIASDLDGQLVAGRWTFNRATVAEYAETKGVLE